MTAADDRDKLFGRNDDITAVEGGSRRDLVYCGPGTDTVFYEKGVDQLFHCERKFAVR